MATRYYTTDAYDQIKSTIETIQQTDLCPVTDFFSDMWIRLMQFFSFLKLDDYKNNIDVWYRKVLDSHNTILTEVDEIFTSAADVDRTYRTIVEDACNSTVKMGEMINNLRDVISGKITMDVGAKRASILLQEGVDSLHSSANAILTRMENRSIAAAAKELVGDLLSAGGNICKMVGALTSGNIPLAVVTAKKLTDGLIGMRGDLGALFITGIAVPVVGKMGMDMGRYLDLRFDMLAKSETLRTTNSVSDILDVISDKLQEKLEDCPEDSPMYPVTWAAAKLSKISSAAGDVVDIAADVYDVYDSISDGIKNVKELFKGKESSMSTLEWAQMNKDKKIGDLLGIKYVKGESHVITKVMPSEVISKIISNRTGVPISDWGNSAKRMGNIFKLGKTIWNYSEKFMPSGNGLSGSGEVTDVIFKNIKEIKLIKDIKDVVQDTINTVGNW